MPTSSRSIALSLKSPKSLNQSPLSTKRATILENYKYKNFTSITEKINSSSLASSPKSINLSYVSKLVSSSQQFYSKNNLKQLSKESKNQNDNSPQIPLQSYNNILQKAASIKSSRFKRDLSISQENKENNDSIQERRNSKQENKDLQTFEDIIIDINEKEKESQNKNGDNFQNIEKQELISPILSSKKQNVSNSVKDNLKQTNELLGEYINKGQYTNKSIKQQNNLYTDQNEILTISNIAKNMNTANFNSRRSSINNFSPLNNNLFDKKIKFKTEIPNQNEDMLNLNHFSLNDKYASIVSAGVNEQKKFKVLKLGNNRITNKGLSIIILSMPQYIQKIDFSYNCFTQEGLYPLIQRINNHSGLNQLVEINLEGNNLGDNSIIKLLNALADYSKIKKLNLSKNSLSQICVPSLCTFLTQNISIQELYLRWNKFKGEAGKQIGESLIDNSSLKVIDLSYNSLGISANNNDKQLCSKTFAKLILLDYKSDLIHIDLSYNQFNYEASIITSEALKNNFSILGFHFSGNNGFMDQYGFLHPQKDIPAIISPLETTISGVKRVDNSNKKMNASQDHCWVCQGWEEKKFIWRPLISGNVQEEPIFILISTEEYIPKKMEKEVNGNIISFTYTGMYPPNQKILYFFIANGHYMFAKEQANEDINLQNVEIIYSDQTVIIPLIQTLNTFITGKTDSIINEETYQYKYNYYPRKEVKLHPKPEERELTLIWNSSMSVFNEYQNELDDYLIDQCFDFDLKYSQIENFINNDFLTFKKYLRSKYKELKDLYKYYSSFKPFLGEKWAIPIEIFTKLLNSGNQNIVDEKNLKIYQIAIIYDEITYNEKKNNINTPVQHLARVAEIKYMQTGQAADHKKAMELLFDKGFQSICNNVSYEHKWRIENVWKQDVDLVLQYYKPLINYLFNKYSQKNSNDSQYQQVIQQTIIQQGCSNQNINQSTNTLKFMSLSEFKTFVYENVKDLSILTPVDIQKCFNLSIQTQVDQIYKNRYLYMSLIEFYESLTRLANLLIVYPVGYDFLNENALNNFKDIYLCCKLEAMLLRIFSKRKEESQLFNEIPVSNTSLFDQKIKLFLYQNQIQSQQTPQDIIQSQISPDSIISRKPSLVLPTPIDYAQSTYQNSNPEIDNFSNNRGQSMINTIKNTIIDGKLTRRSNSALHNFKSIYLSAQSTDEISMNLIKEKIQYAANNQK